jgi:prepilin-type N-terminal cleavage/methylation domain-containing protein
MKRNMIFLSHRGFSLLEVVIAIAIFAIGMLALASLQGSLSRSSADSNLRAIAADIAERTIEDFRAFSLIDTDPNGILPAYGDIVDSLPLGTDNPLITDDGVISFARTINVTDYFYVLAQDTFLSQDALDAAGINLGVSVSDFKLVEVNVSWEYEGFADTAGNLGPGFGFDESQTFSNELLGTGGITLSAIVASISTQGAGRVTTQQDDSGFDPFISYTPGENPDIVSLDLQGNKFKESLTPEPEVFRENLETRFDVVTYGGSSNSLFLRREEFIAVSCECTLRAADSAKPGRRPVIWAGDEYIESEPVSKAFGEVINNIQQSPLCDTCCKDHHDGGSSTSSDAGAILYDPFRSSVEYGSDGDHKHYTKSSSRKDGGTLEVAIPGDSYVEACRLVRKDGFFRLAQDFRSEGLNVFAEDFLISSNQVADYSDYVTGEISTYLGTVMAQPLLGKGYQSSPPEVTPPVRTELGAQPNPDTDLTLAYTYLPTTTGAEFQQLRSRTIYIDYLSDDLRRVINCINLKTSEGASEEEKLKCETGDVKLDRTGSTNILEIIPFFEVQTTFLNEWDENPIDAFVEVTNEAVKTNNSHSRGRGTKIQTAGSAMAHARGHRGVLGLTATDPIDNAYEIKTKSGEINVVINTTNPPEPSGKIIVGTIISYVPGVQAAKLIITDNDASCNFTNPDFACFVPAGSPSPTMRLEGFQKKNTKVVACSNSSALPPANSSDTSGNPFATFSLANSLEAPDPAYVIWLDVDICTGR